MRKVFILLVCSLAVVSCKDSVNTRQTADLSQKVDSLNRVNIQKDNEINDMLEAFNTIEEGFRAINEAQNRVTVERSGEGATSTERIRENIQFIQETLSQNKELINKLRLRLRDSSIASEQLKKTLENLTTQLAEKESELTVLRSELAAKDIHIAELDEQVTSLTEDVSNLRDESARRPRPLIIRTRN
jgi:chromosome segregation ATPase